MEIAESARKIMIYTTARRVRKLTANCEIFSPRARRASKARSFNHEFMFIRFAVRELSQKFNKFNDKIFYARKNIFSFGIIWIIYQN